MSKPTTLIVKAKEPALPVLQPNGRASRVIGDDGRDQHAVHGEWKEVPNDSFHRKRVRAGDLVEATPEEAEAFRKAQADGPALPDALLGTPATTEALEPFAGNETLAGDVPPLPGLPPELVSDDKPAVDEREE